MQGRPSGPGQGSTSGAPRADSSTPFAIERRCFTGAQSLAFVGELDLASAPLAGGELRDAGALGDVVVLDLLALSFIDCAGLRVLLAADARLRETGGRLVIVHSSRQVRRLFDLTGVTARLDMVWDTDDLSAEPTREARDAPVAALGTADVG